MGNSSCCRPIYTDTPTFNGEAMKEMPTIQSNRKEKPENNICITASTCLKNSSDKARSISEFKEDKDDKEEKEVNKTKAKHTPKDNLNTTKDLLSPKKIDRKPIEIVNNIFEEEQLNKLKAYLLKEKIIHEEMNDSIRNMIVNCISYIRVKEGIDFYLYDSKANDNNDDNDNDNDYYYIIDKGHCKLIINSTKSIKIKRKTLISTYSIKQNENNKYADSISTIKIQTGDKRAYLYKFSYKKYKSILDDFKTTLLEEISIILRQVYFFRSFDKKTISQLALSTITHTYKEKTPILQEDKLIESLYVVGEGNVVCSKGEKIIRRLSQCAVFNDIALFNKIESLYSYSADVDITTVYEIEYSVILSLCGGGSLTKMIATLLTSAIKRNALLSKYFSQENITIISPLFRLGYYFNDFIIRKKQRKLLIPLAGVIYQQGDGVDEQDKKEVGIHGEIFGETLLNQHCNSITSVINTIESVVLVAEWNEILKVLKCFHNKSFSLYEKVNLLRSCENSIIKKLSDLKLFQIAEEMKLIKFKENEVIVNSASDKLYILYKGNISVMINDLEVKRLKEAESFGFYSLSRIDNRPKPTFISKSPIECFFIEKVRYEEIVDSDILKPYNKLKQTKSIISITIDQLYYLKDLGKGSYGNVYLVHDRKRKYALKTAEIESLKQNQASAQCYLNEKTIMSSIEHPFIVKLFTTFKTKEYIFFLMEYVMGMTLRQRIEKQNKKNLRNSTFVQFYGAILCSILNYLGIRRIIHRDIKPENIIVEKNGYIKLIDFGIAKDLAGKDYTSTVIGTMWYLAPEMVLGKDYSFAVDYWSTGIILYECYYGYFPFGLGLSDPVKIYKEIAENKLTLASDPKNESFNDFIGKLLNKNPNKRINSFSKWINHPFFSGFDFEKLLKTELIAPTDDSLIISPNTIQDEDDNEVLIDNTGCPFQQFMKNNIFCSSTDLGDILKNNKGEDFLSEF